MMKVAVGVHHEVTIVTVYDFAIMQLPAVAGFAILQLPAAAGFALLQLPVRKG